MSRWFDGKATVYYSLGTDDTKWRQLESFTVSLIPRWEAPLNESSTGLAGKYLQWFPSRSGSLGSTFAAQVSWSRFVWQRSLAVFSFPQDWKVMLNTQVTTRDAFVLSVSVARWHHAAARCQCHPGLHNCPPGLQNPKKCGPVQT